MATLAGLATQTDLNILNANEEKMRIEEEKTQKELKTIETKTQISFKSLMNKPSKWPNYTQMKQKSNKPLKRY